MINTTVLYFNPINPLCKQPIGAVPTGTPVELNLLTVMPLDCNDRFNVSLHIEADTALAKFNFVANMKEIASVKHGQRDIAYKAVIDVLNTPGLYFYKFAITDMNGETIYIDNNGKPFQLTVYDKNIKPNKKFLSSVVYQVFPDRFYRSGKVNPADCGRRFGDLKVYGDWYELPQYEKNENGDIAKWDFFGGDLYGVEEKLDYIHSLGADKVYLNPIFEAASNHRYDTGDYEKIDPMLGGEAAFDKLNSSCKSKKMGLILDCAFSHTGCDSKYFNKYNHYDTVGAYYHFESPYRSWYKFEENNDDEYDCWWGCKDLPNVNELDPGYMDYIITGKNSVVKKWLSKGLAGLRIDVADELPDEFILKLKQTVDKETDDKTVVIGEVWEDASNKISYDKRRRYLTSNELTGVTGYVFRNLFVDFLTNAVSSAKLQMTLFSLFENYPLHSLYSSFFMTGSHDVKRLYSIFKDYFKGDDERAVLAQKCFASVMFTFPGIPTIYYGDEICLEGDVDPDNRRTYPWGREPNPDMLAFFRKLGEYRRKAKVLQTGFFEVITCDNDIFGFKRIFKDNKDIFDDNCGREKVKGVLCFINRTSEPREIVIDTLDPKAKMVSLFDDNETYTTDSDGKVTLTVKDFKIFERVE